MAGVALFSGHTVTFRAPPHVHGVRMTIMRSIKDSKQNKNRNIAQLVEHLSDKLVMWGWDPGEGRLPVPMIHDEFSAKVKQWADSGAACPK